MFIMLYKYGRSKIMDSRRFKSKMCLYDDTIKSLAKKLGLATATLSRKINGHADFTQSEMFRIKNIYELSNEEFMEIFSTKEVEA